MDEPLVQYSGAGTANRTFLHADARGSIIAHTDSTGALTATLTYDEYGNPGASNPSTTYGYTGQVWLADVGLYHYKNRAYHPGLMRFLQTDPIGVSGGMNLYAYVGGDPVNMVDPWGLEAEDPDLGGTDDVIVVTGVRINLRHGTKGAPGLDVVGGFESYEPLISPELQARMDELMESLEEEEGGDQNRKCNPFWLWVSNALAHQSWQFGQAGGIAANVAVGSAAIRPSTPRVRAVRAGAAAFAVASTAGSIATDIASGLMHAYATGRPTPVGGSLFGWGVRQVIDRQIDQAMGPLGRAAYDTVTGAEDVRGLFTPPPKRKTCD